MEKAYDHSKTEEGIYAFWEKNGYFQPEVNPNGKPFSIILPPPNANADLHVGHAMYVVEDILIRFHRMKGDKTLWLPGADHAGFETQYVFEKHLAKEGKSRFDYPRDELYQKIWDFVHVNRSTMENQLRRLGFSLDWTRNTFTLDPNVVKTVYDTFKKLYDDGLIYRGQRLVNYCTKCGTGFSDLEVNYVEKNDPLYYIKYGPFTIATVRPETKFRDTALAVNPKDKRYKKYIGQTLEIMGLLGPISMTVIPDEEVDPKFGTGIMKVTPAHDPHDFELGKKFNLPVTPIIDFKGRMDFSWFLSQENKDPKYKARAEKYHGKKVAEARLLMVEDLKEDGLLVKVDEKYVHRIGTCYKSGTVLEPLPMAQWFVKIRPLADRAIAAINKAEVEFVPKRFKKTASQWLTNFHDWNISRQIVWGMRIPAWKCLNCSKNGKEEWVITKGEMPKACPNCEGSKLEQDMDTFDTWFSSGQWPTATLKANKPDDFKTFYPTSVMETGYDILPWWVCRMIMLGLYMNNEVPFKTVYLHGLVRDGKGQKMSKSKGNVMNPLVMVDKYGADALRMALIYAAAAGNDLALSEDKIRGMRNFTNKLWNIARFIEMNISGKKVAFFSEIESKQSEEAEWMKLVLQESKDITKKITKHIEKYNLGLAAEDLYEYVWHVFADKHVEAAKDMLLGESENAKYIRGVLIEVLERILLLLHPFMPFITEELYKKFEFPQKNNALITASWPQNR